MSLIGMTFKTACLHGSSEIIQNIGTINIKAGNKIYICEISEKCFIEAISYLIWIYTFCKFNYFQFWHFLSLMYHFIAQIPILGYDTNSADLVQMPPIVASEQGLHRFP